MLFRTLLSRLRREIIVSPRRFTSQNVPNNLTLEVNLYQDKEAVEDSLDFIASTFLKDEPIVRAMGIEDKCDLLRYFKRQMKGGTILRLTDQECHTAALALCTVTTPTSAQDARTFAECSICDPKTKRLLNLWADISESYDLFRCLKVNELWEISVLVSAPSHRGKGLSKLLAYEARVEGKKAGFSMIRMDCTNLFSAKVAERLQFVTLPPRHIMTFRDKKGSPWLPKEPEHPQGNVIITYDFLV